MRQLFPSHLDPRTSLGAAIGWSMLVVSIVIAAISGLWATHVGRTAVLASQKEHLQALADQVAGELSQGIVLRRQALRAAASMLAQRSITGGMGDAKTILDDLRQAFPELVAIEAFDRDQRRIAVSRAGTDESAEPIGKFIALVSPVRDSQGHEISTLVAQLNWEWVSAMGQAINPEMHAEKGEEWLLVDDRERVQTGSKVARVGLRFGDEGTYLKVSARPTSAPELVRLGWRVVAIQPLAEVRHDANVTGSRIFISILLLGLAGGMLFVPLGRRLTRRIEMITASAEQMLNGTVQQIAVPTGRDESARLGEVLSRLIDALQAERETLKQLNAELDLRVALRTREIERLAEESRYASTVRERLRLARDLHDTLGHSMMAMVAQIRLLKRLATSDPAGLPAELEQAEVSARDGLAEARAAITQLRFNAVRDIGLGTALGDHLKRFGERTGIQTEFSCDPAVTDFAEASAETLFHMVEEGLRNVERHAGAERVSVSLSIGKPEERLRIILVDNGKGFDQNILPPGHYGLVGMKEQARLIGANLFIDACPGNGTRIVISLIRPDQDATPTARATTINSTSM